MTDAADMKGSPARQTLPQRLWVVLGGLRQAIAAWGGRDRAAVPLVVLAWGRVGRIAQRFAALVAHLQAGTLPAPRVRVWARREHRATCPRLPRGFGWLGQALPEARGFGAQLEALLAEPEMAALLAECPRADRLLRPLRRMLGMVARPGPPPRVRRPRAAWWQAPPPAPAAPTGPLAFPTGRPPPSWHC